MAVLSVLAHLVAQSPAARADTLFAADFNAGNIYTFAPSGVRTTFASGLVTPADVAFDRQGNLYVSEFNTGSIYRYTSGGSRTLLVSGLGNIDYLAVDASGNVYAEDNGSYNNGALYKVRPDGSWSTLAHLGLYPHALACDQSGNLFAAVNSGLIYKFAPNGTQSLFASGLGDPEGLTFGPDGCLYVGCYLTKDIRKFSPDGTQSTVVAGGVRFPLSLAFDSQGNLFSAEMFNINEFINTGGVLSPTPVVFASGLADANGIAFQPVPEPALSGLLALGLVCLLGRGAARGSHPTRQTR